MGFEVTDMAKKVQLASVRFPNGSGSFVSPYGLVLTNYHIVEDAVGELSSATKDYAKEGFCRAQSVGGVEGGRLSLDSARQASKRYCCCEQHRESDMSATRSNATRRAQMTAIEAQSLQQTG